MAAPTHCWCDAAPVNRETLSLGVFLGKAPDGAKKIPSVGKIDLRVRTKCMEKARSNADGMALVIRARTARPRASLVAGVLKLRPLWLDQNAKGKPQLHIEATPLPACQPQWQTLLCAAAIGGPSRNSLLTVLPRFGRRSFLDETGRLRCSAGHDCIRKAWWDRAEAAKTLPPTR